ncbi:MAG: GDSL-type esterase/lipase family protein [Bryobacterales bacterium]|nr:GDSL-type esterase/lipase family protein [Bryobacteraceae bacterium]MDW8131039.1 GDSL-type esterase/lipase family protein [Bryobacterales bacterium]
MTKPACLMALLLACCVAAQEKPLMSSKDVLATCERVSHLIESTATAAPDLVRASAPLSENVRQACLNLRVISPQHGVLTYTLLTNLRAYLALADALPKPQPTPAEVLRQLGELRDLAARWEAHFAALLEQKEFALRHPDRDNLRRYAEANRKLGPPQPGSPRVVFLGDSITDGWRLNEYFPDRDFVNRGISGQITGEMLGRMKADVLDLKPAAVLVLGGTNDIARGVELATIQNNLTMIADLAEFRGIKPLLASLLPVCDYHKDKNPAYEHTRRRPPEQIRRLNEWIQNFCRQRNLVYVDYYSQMVDSAGMLRAELTDDGLHPNAAGYRLMAPVALAAIEKALAPAARRRR